jgi:Single-stranded DNA binding protein Ssb-like, OB fold
MVGRDALRHRNVDEGEYLAFLSVKHGVSSDSLFQTLVSTREKQKNICGNLTIECRGRSGSKRIFLVREGVNVVAQIKIGEEFLSEKTNPITRFNNSERIRRYVAKKNACMFKQSVISDLHAGMSGVNLNVKLLEIGKPTAICTLSGNQGVVANALIGDKTGTARLSLWGDQIESVSAGDTIQIFNARILVIKGEKQLRIGKDGALKVEHGR